MKKSRVVRFASATGPDARRAERLGEKSIHFIDAGTSGGIWGLENGYCLMVGAEQEVGR